MTASEIINTAMRRHGIRSKRELARECGYKRDKESGFVHALEHPERLRMWFWVMLDEVLRFTDSEWLALRGRG